MRFPPILQWVWEQFLVAPALLKGVAFAVFAIVWVFVKGGAKK